MPLRKFAPTFAFLCALPLAAQTPPQSAGTKSSVEKRLKAEEKSGAPESMLS